MSRKVYTIAKKEFLQMMREKSFILVLVFEILLVSSSAFLSAGYEVINSPESSQILSGSKRILFVGLVTDTIKEMSLPMHQAGITYFNYKSLTAAEQDFQQGIIDAIVQGNLHLDQEPSVITIYLPENTPKIGLIRLALKKFILNVEQRLRDVKIMVYTPDIHLLSYKEANLPRNSQDFEVFLIFTLPFLFFMPCVMSGSLIIDSLTEDIESKRILNLLCAPLGELNIILGKCLGSFAVTIPHCVIWVILLSYTEYAPMNPIGIILFFTLYTVFFISSGAYIAVRIRHNRPAQMAATLVAVLSIALFSPQVNFSTTLVLFSPAYVFTQLALGASILSLWWQALSVLLLNVICLGLLKNSAKQLSNMS